jgi:hypothetical protein
MTRECGGGRINPGAIAAQKRASKRQPVSQGPCYCLVNGKTDPAEIHVNTPL